VFSIADPVVTEIVDSLCGREDHPAQGAYTWQELASLERGRRAAGGC
jgi:hypothetical protein